MNQEVKAETDNRKKRAERRGRREGGRKEGKERKGSVVGVGVGEGWEGQSPEDLCRIVPHVTPTTQSVKRLNSFEPLKPHKYQRFSSSF